MKEHIVYVSRESSNSFQSDWMDKVKKTKGITFKSEDLNGMVINCTDEAAQKLRDTFNYLKVEHVFETPQPE
jgi:hypothetical protein